ncbi:hypothetical protein M407DRAFT_243675 [Tulasnella calospora MUT 4182]|uniref:Uncharacterized protein n=1 Tax=Tulasnella calospora MUT 4182 TaxID=1051891 RepID=A0A0C3Q9A3_9AGAM|nr:hypothetical protein M407DRAFT_243675 [Tulasnella calospora MUT 4182]
MADSKTQFNVTWPVGDQTWKEVTDIPSITRYRLYPITHIFYSYQLDFTNSVNLDFIFYDQSGDRYTKSTFVNGDHSVHYKSDDPTILLVKAEEPGGI